MPRQKPTKAERESVTPRHIQLGGHSTDGVDPALVEQIARRIIRPLRERAKLMGYAVAEHGSRARDIDLVAIPWTDKAVAPERLAKSLRQVLDDLYPVELDVGPNLEHPKPHGRLCWSFWVRPWTYVDLSVMPPTAKSEA